MNSKKNLIKKLTSEVVNKEKGNYKYRICYAFDNEDQMFVGVCPDLLGFIVESKTENELKKESLRVLRIYNEDKTIALNEIEFVQKKIKMDVEVQLWVVVEVQSIAKMN